MKITALLLLLFIQNCAIGQSLDIQSLVHDYGFKDSIVEIDSTSSKNDVFLYGQKQKIAEGFLIFNKDTIRRFSTLKIGFGFDQEGFFSSLKKGEKPFLKYIDTIVQKEFNNPKFYPKPYQFKDSIYLFKCIFDPEDNNIITRIDTVGFKEITINHQITIKGKKAWIDFHYKNIKVSPNYPNISFDLDLLHPTKRARPMLRYNCTRGYDSEINLRIFLSKLQMVDKEKYFLIHIHGSYPAKTDYFSYKILVHYQA